eukprot:TRINITY_DN7039_c0_g1_i1.p1 TRINITY_DN7039_c0_g1~~TRINITY_DN7039_c0_g1_i1.p1  ORF type:complete len:327 (+),score=51.90 TRINITY_DN7039_c0_g1_i1:262-1242(+)
MKSCHLCPKSFQNERQLQRHLKSHAEQLPFSCDHCEKRFHRRDGLRQHVLATHPQDGKPQFPCRLCSRAFRHRASLLRHVKRSHPDEHASGIVKDARGHRHKAMSPKKPNTGFVEPADIPASLSSVDPDLFVSPPRSVSLPLLPEQPQQPANASACSTVSSSSLTSPAADAFQDDLRLLQQIDMDDVLNNIPSGASPPLSFSQAEFAPMPDDIKPPTIPTTSWDSTGFASLGLPHDLLMTTGAPTTTMLPNVRGPLPAGLQPSIPTISSSNPAGQDPQVFVNDVVRPLLSNVVDLFAANGPQPGLPLTQLSSMLSDPQLLQYLLSQ